MVLFFSVKSEYGIFFSVSFISLVYVRAKTEHICLASDNDEKGENCRKKQGLELEIENEKFLCNSTNHSAFATGDNPGRHSAIR